MNRYKDFINNPRIKYYDNGRKKLEEWIVDGKYHREDGPAIIEWYDNGQKEFESWCLKGEYHREDGPAYQEWFYGQLSHKELWLNGKQYLRKEWVEELKKIGSPHYGEQRMLLDVEKYNL
jgi:antitoxin component YwqK of YwqJK toxin-antitoxin module